MEAEAAAQHESPVWRDVVETEAKDGHDHFVSRVAEPSGRFAMRVWFLDTSVADEVAERLTAIGALLEWRGHWSRLLAVDQRTRR